VKMLANTFAWFQSMFDKDPDVRHLCWCVLGDRPAFQRFLDATKHVERQDGFYVERRQVPCELEPSTQVCLRLFVAR
jgi:hypothetical protein